MANEQNKQDNKDVTSATGTSGIAGSGNSTSNQDAASGSSQSGSGTGSFSGGSQSGTGGGSQSGQGGGSKGTGGSSAADELASSVGNVLRGDTGAATSTAKGIVSQVKESGGKVAGEALGQVKEKATTKIDEQRTNLAQGLGSVADTIRQVGDNIRDASGENQVATLTAQYGDTLAKQVEQFSGYLEKHNVSELMRDVERFARRNPAYFIGGAFALGLLGARFLKSSSPNQALMPYEGGSGRNTGKGRKEVFHPHSGTEPIDKGNDVSGSGEGIRPL